MKRQYITRGKYAATVEVTVTPQERNRVALNFTIVEGETASIARINIVGNKAFTEAQLRREMTLSTPNWLSWYTKDDQYCEAEALRRPRVAAQLLPEPRLPRVQHRVHPGVDLARQGRGLPHGQPHRGRALHASPRSTSRASSRWPSPSCAALLAVKPGDTFSRARMQAVGQGDQRAAGQRRLRVRQRQRGARHRPRQEHGRLHVLRRRRPPRLRAQDQHQRQSRRRATK